MRGYDRCSKHWITGRSILDFNKILNFPSQGKCWSIFNYGWRPKKLLDWVIVFVPNKTSKAWSLDQGPLHSMPGGCQFPPIMLQETKNSASWPFTLEAKFQRPLRFQMVFFFVQNNKLSKEVWIKRQWKPKVRSRGRPCFYFIRKSIINIILVVGLEGLFWTRNKVGFLFGFEFWGWLFATYDK